MTDKELKEQKKLDSQQRLVTQRTINGLLSQFSFKNIKTWSDVCSRIGYDKEYINSHFTLEQLATQVDLASLKAYCFKMKEETEERIRKKYELQTKPASDLDSSRVLPSSSKTTTDTTTTPTLVQPANPPPAHFQPAQSVSPAPTEVNDESGFNNSNDYGLWPSPKEKAYLFWFQKRAIREALDGVL